MLSPEPCLHGGNDRKRCTNISRNIYSFDQTEFFLASSSLGYEAETDLLEKLMRLNLYFGFVVKGKIVSGHFYFYQMVKVD